MFSWPPRPATRRPILLREKAPLILILLLTAAVYAQAALFEFVYDDIGQIVYNPGIKSWRLALGYFTTHVWAQTGGNGLYYRPLFMLWLAANYSPFGLHPLYWHVLAIGLHLLCCALLYCFARRLTNDALVSAVAVALFGLHPAHIASVVWISGATETLFGASVIASLLCYMRSFDHGAAVSKWRTASLLLAAAGVLSKETAVVLPALVFAYEWIVAKRGKPYRHRLEVATHAAIPYALIVAGYIAMRAIALHGFLPPRTTVPAASVVLAWPRVILFYLGHTLFPVRLSAFYHPILLDTPGAMTFVGPLVLISLSAAVLGYGARRSHVFGFLFAWGVALLVPILSVTLLHNFENVHDRYLYLPSAAFCIMLASLLGRLWRLGARRSASAALTVILAGYAVLTIRQSQIWENDIRLGEHGLAIAPGHPVAAQMLGNAHIRNENAAAAIPYLLTSLDADPENSDTLASLGFCYLNLGSLSSAETFLNRAIQAAPHKGRPHLLLGVVRMRQNRPSDAETEFRSGFALERTPERVQEFHYRLGELLYAKGDLRGARREFLLEAQNDEETDPAVPFARERLRSINERR